MERGNFRSIYCALVYGPDFQALSPGAKLVFYTLKMTLGPSGIDVVPALVASLVEHTGADESNIEKALTQLTRAGWIKRERNIVWIVDGLKHDPSFKMTNANHRANVAKHLDGLPRLAIVDEFRAYYFPPRAEMPSSDLGEGGEDGTQMPSKEPSKRASKSPSASREEGKGRGKGKTDEGISAARRRSGDGHGRSGHVTWLTPFADAWRQRYGGEMAAGTAVRALRKLYDEHGEAEVLRRWTIYLDATAAEYANAPRFASTWGNWERPPHRSDNGNGTAHSSDDTRAEAIDVVARIRALIVSQPVPGQSTKRFIRPTDVDALGAEIGAAYRALGGAPRFLDDDTKGFLARDFALALATARRAASPPPSGGTTP